MKFQFLPENFSRSENAPPFETRKIRHFEVERIFLENKKMVDDLAKAEKIYSWVAEACGNELGKVMTKERIEQIVSRRTCFRENCFSIG